MTPTGIEPATFRFVSQHLNHCATAVPNIYMYWTQLKRRLITFSPEEVIRSGLRNLKFIVLYFLKHWKLGNV